MAPHFLSVFAFSLVMSTPAGPQAPSAAAPSRIVVALSFKDRCAIAGLLAKEMRDLLGWIDPRRLPGVMGDDGFSLLIVPPGKGDEIRSLFGRDEKCAVSLDPVFPGAGKLEVRLASDPPAPLPTGRAYALLFMRSLGPARWQFDWSLSASGYAGCPADENTEGGGLDACRHPAFLHGAPSADLRIVITKKRSGFEAEVANLEVPKWSAPRPPSE